MAPKNEATPLLDPLASEEKKEDVVGAPSEEAPAPSLWSELPKLSKFFVASLWCVSLALNIWTLTPNVIFIYLDLEPAVLENIDSVSKCAPPDRMQELLTG